ncbi:MULTISPECIES: L-threonylcarbamoyladenylate synthase [unclassified Novosphingobium]|uniref:L-threonylcarbamoyladenylate synthase n=1 Tax=unclassified Novosphingobium TaxID=2644732 RepID=UPI000ED70FF6|nr:MULTISPECIES: L-threonylcarbamoyladenylate synthase [unclassified Novosphingobium]HCF25150.1 threonylcarbamoyl-AMP synthase [Novosphingobium sp.]HQV02441.1 L-threonylcarbamoyladenylate synthase [Novosphingobium sp.]
MTGKVQIRSGDAAGIAAAAEVLRAGGLVAVPTETVYGLAARADSAATVAAIYRAKGRPDFNPLIVHVPDLAAAEEIAELDDRARMLAARFWPGPLTMVLPLKPTARIAPAVTAGLSTIALRCPAHPVMRAVLAESGLALAAPSANRSGGVSPTRAEHVAASLGDRVDLVLDGGACTAGIESTIVALRGEGWQVLRPGPITGDEIAALIGPPLDATAQGRIEAPGQLASHYSPGKPVRLNALWAEGDEFLIGFGAVAGQVTLSASGDLAEAAARLYECLHAGQAASAPRIAIAPVPGKGIGAAINDRLLRAAA